MQHNSPIHFPLGSRNGFRLAGLSAVFFLLLLAGTQTGSSARTPVPHPLAQARQVSVPSVPVVLNGLRFAPEVVKSYAGQNLHYVIDAQALDEGVVYAFLTPQERDHFLQARGHARAAGVSTKSTAGPTATFWEHENRRGAVTQYSTSVFSLGAWSDVISSLETGTRSVRLWEHEAFRGASLTIPADVIVEDLRPFGWSDVASSIQFL